ncbi:alpha/beta hydrolase [uncultured Parasphingorhabdus sp.]|uniref:alpha/beta fold hydrolase n=1 Tax=uncultured Parasphingorhabdus sp. TaxID=2709694 RepID=UPI002AA63CD3|nr:alpha/beta hydrolase [uncultured Parasphingorhabdus sp.]
MTQNQNQTEGRNIPIGPWEEIGKVPVAGGFMQWAKVGSGPPIVLLPKIGGWIDDWRHVAKLLKADYQVIAIDPPGHGGSEMLGDPPFMISLEHSAAAVMTTLDMLGIKQFVAAGNSMGGLILLAASALWPGRISKLCLISSALIEPLSLDKVREASANRQKNGDQAPTYEEVDSMFSLTQETYDEFVLSKNVAGLWKEPCICGVGFSGPINYLSRSATPIMLISGANSNVFWKSEQEALRLRPDIRCESIEDCGSFAQQDKPDETHALMLDFFG